MSKGQKSVDGISEAKIEKAISEHYEHESVMLPPEEARDETPPRSERADGMEKDQDSPGKSKAKKGKKEKKEEKAGSQRAAGGGKAKSVGTHSLQTDSHSENSDQQPEEEEEEEAHNLEDLLMHIYYKKDEIDKVKFLQEHDVFEDLIFDKQTATADGVLTKSRTKINIVDFMPKKVEVVDPKAKKDKKKGKKGGVQDSDDEETENEEVTMAQILARRKQKVQLTEQEKLEREHKRETEMLEHEIKDLLVAKETEHKSKSS